MKNIVITILFVFMAMISFSALAPMHTLAATAPQTSTGCKTNNYILPTWYKYLKFDKNCDIKMTSAELPKNLILIGLAIIEMLLVLAGIIAVIMTIVGGFKYVISQGEPEKIGVAKMTIINSLIGATIAILASQLVAFIGGAFGGGNPDSYGLIHVPATANNLQKGLNIFFAIIGAVSVFMIVFAGFNFVISGGNSEKVTKARRTIYYAIIGVIVAIFASALINFVLYKVT